MAHGLNDLGQYWLKWWDATWRHKAITNVDLSSIRSCGIHLMKLLIGNVEDSIYRMTFEYCKISPTSVRLQCVNLLRHIYPVTCALDMFSGRFVEMMNWVGVHHTGCVQWYQTICHLHKWQFITPAPRNSAGWVGWNSGFSLSVRPWHENLSGWKVFLFISDYNSFGILSFLSGVR